jgi:two-component system, chemotaxis family, CheB/CheR fusion protein
MNPPEAGQELEALLDYLKRSRGFDFTGYKRMSLVRRIRRRMQAVGIESYPDYTDYLEVHPDEFVQLFNTILINVTGFFRDASTWEFLAQEVIPKIAERPTREPIRIWSAGCASGEEACSLAILLAEALGIEQFRDRVKIYATDLDEEALTKARHASYAPRDMSGLSAEQIERYFEPSGGRHLFHRELRRSVIFGRHDLIQDAPISRVDLLSCRNTLMYLNAETQARILARLHFALNETGYLFLGKAEMLMNPGGNFLPVDLKRRIFRKVPKANLRDRLVLMAQAGSEEAVNHLVSHVRMRDSAFDQAPVAQIVVDVSGSAVMANDRARQIFGMTARDMGRPFQDLDVSYRPVELRSVIEQAYSERRTIAVRDVEWGRDATGPLYLNVEVTPLHDTNGAAIGASITFDDVTRVRRLQDELRHSNEELETASEELQSTNEELETTNEELQSTIEELETTNEELQSTNEELETMNEELQSTNEELQTINEELRRRTEELGQTNLFLEAILGSLRDGVAVLDRDLRVLIWNKKAEDLWGLRADEVYGEHFLNLDIGLPAEQLRRPVRMILTGETESTDVALDATNRRGKAIRCHVAVAPLKNAGGEIRGAIVLMGENGA